MGFSHCRAATRCFLSFHWGKGGRGEAVSTPAVGPWSSSGPHEHAQILLCCLEFNMLNFLQQPPGGRYRYMCEAPPRHCRPAPWRQQPLSKTPGFPEEISSSEAVFRIVAARRCEKPFSPIHLPRFCFLSRRHLRRLYPPPTIHGAPAGLAISSGMLWVSWKTLVTDELYCNPISIRSLLL